MPDTGDSTHSKGVQQNDRERFTFVLECPRYGCGTMVATTSTTAGAFEAPPHCYCPNHDDWQEMEATEVKEPDDAE